MHDVFICACTRVFVLQGGWAGWEREAHPLGVQRKSIDFCQQSLGRGLAEVASEVPLDFGLSFDPAACDHDNANPDR